MGRLYTLDNKLLCGSPEIRIGDKMYPVDDRKNTVLKVMKIMDGKSETADKSKDFTNIEEVMKLAFGKNYSEIEKLELSFTAFTELSQLVMSAMTGIDESDKNDTVNFQPSRGTTSDSTRT